MSSGGSAPTGRRETALAQIKSEAGRLLAFIRTMAHTYPNGDRRDFVLAMRFAEDAGYYAERAVMAAPDPASAPPDG